METSPTPPSFNLTMDVSPLNLGEAYAGGMRAGSQVGEDIGKGISSAFDTMAQNRAADDTLLAMNQTGMLSDRAYQAVAGKALGAKQTMLGMFASQWIQAQSQNRELQKLGYQGNVDIQVAHAKLLDQLAANRVGGTGQAANQNVATRAAPAQPVNAPMQTFSNISGAPSPVAQYGVAGPPISQQFTVGAPYGKKEAIPAGAIRATVRDPASGKALQGFTTLDATTGRKMFRPVPGQ